MSELMDITPEELEYAKLEEDGWYGPNLENEADVELAEFKIVPKGSTEDFPNFDKKAGHATENYMKFSFRVTSERDGVVNLGPRVNAQWFRYFRGVTTLERLGVAMERYEVPGKKAMGAKFDPETVAPQKIGGIKIESKPGREGGKFYNVLEVAGQ